MTAYVTSSCLPTTAQFGCMMAKHWTLCGQHGSMGSNRTGQCRNDILYHDQLNDCVSVCACMGSCVYSNKHD